MIHALQHADKKQAHVIRDAIVKGKRESLDAVIDVIKSTHAIDYTYNCAAEHVEKAKVNLQAIPASSWRQALAALAEFAITRHH